MLCSDLLLILHSDLILQTDRKCNQLDHSIFDGIVYLLSTQNLIVDIKVFDGVVNKGLYLLTSPMKKIGSMVHHSGCSKSFQVKNQNLGSL